MKKIIALSLALFVMILPSCSQKEIPNDGADNIIGEWQPYGIKIDNQVEAFEDEERAKLIAQYAMVFNEDGTVMIKSGGPEINGTYSKNDNGYVVTVPISESDPTAQMKCCFDEEFLIVEQILPEGYEDYDTGDPMAYKKVE